jgi:DNA primase
MESEKIDFASAVTLLAERAGIALPPSDPQEARTQGRRKRLQALLQEAAQWFHAILLGPEGEEARQYLAARGIAPPMWDAFQLGFAPARGGLSAFLAKQGYLAQELVESGLCCLSERGSFERFRARLLFPITDTWGHCVGFGGRVLKHSPKEAKYVNSPESPLFDKSKLLYGYAHARKSAQTDPVLVVEGYLDVIALHQAGFERAVAPLGTAAQAHQIEACWKLCAEPVIMFDGDSAGQQAAIRLVKRLLSVLQPGYSARCAVLPAGEDPDSFIRGKGPSALQKLLREARPLSEVLWTHAILSMPRETPEQRALAWKQVGDMLSEIAHPAVQRFYREDFRKRWETLYRSPKGSWGLRLAQARSPSPSLPFRILLATVIRHPEIFKAVEESLFCLPPQEASLDGAKEEILNFLSRQSFKNPEDLVQLLEERIPESIVQSIMSEEVSRCAPFTRAGSSTEEAMAGFQEVWSRFFGAAALKGDIQQTRGLLEASFDPTHWERLQELCTLQERERRGEI